MIAKSNNIILDSSDTCGNVTVAMFASRLGISKRFAWELVRQRKIASVRLGKTVRIRPIDIEKLIKEHTVPALAAQVASTIAKRILM